MHEYAPVNPTKWPLLYSLHNFPLPSTGTLALGSAVTALTMKTLVILLGLITASLQSGGRGLGIDCKGSREGTMERLWDTIYLTHRSRSCYNEDYSL